MKNYLADCKNSIPMRNPREHRGAVGFFIAAEGIELGNASAQKDKGSPANVTPRVIQQTEIPHDIFAAVQIHERLTPIEHV